MNPAEAHEFTRLDLPALSWEYALVREAETDGGTVVQRQPGGEWSPLMGLRPVPIGGGVQGVPETEAERIKLAKTYCYMAELGEDAWERARDATVGGSA